MTQSLKYQGTHLLADSNLIFKLNFLTISHTIQKVLGTWSAPAVSWFGRCNTLKMNIMPKLLYLLQTLLIHIL